MLRTFIKLNVVVPLHALLGAVLALFGSVITRFRSPRLIYTLVIDHSLGGGTTLYRQNRIAQMTKESKENVLLVTNFHFAGANSALRIEQKSSEESITYFVSLNSLQRVLERYRIVRIECNSIVFFNDAPFFLSALKSLAEKKRIAMTYFVHDYYSVCPEYQLMYRESFCKLECTKNNCELTYPFTKTRVDLHSWRFQWLDFLTRCDEIVFFSEASKRIFSRVYPTLTSSKLSLVPHSMSYFPKPTRETISSQRKPVLKVAAVGAISSTAKGSLVVANLIDYCHLREVKLEFMILGSFDKSLQLKGEVKVTGPYPREKLSELITSQEISIVLFPSVWPETFSYLVSELIILEVPIVCFDIGAQGDKVREYARGYVCESAEPEKIIEGIVTLSKRLGLDKVTNEKV